MRGYSIIALDNPKSNINVGSALRACQIYESKMLVVSGTRYHHASTDTMKAHKHLPLIQVENILEAIPFDCVPVAIDLIKGAQSLVDYKHPERAFYIFGAEDATLGKHITDKCRDIVMIPTKSSMNLAATVNVVLYDRMSKQK